MANQENLRALSTKEAREIGRKGGKKSVEVRRAKKTMKETLQELLKLPCDVEGETCNGYMAASIALYRQALAGNVKAYEVIRDTIGEKPVSGINLESGTEDPKEIKITFVDKTTGGNSVEDDPKIVGDYTPSVDT